MYTNAMARAVTEIEEELMELAQAVGSEEAREILDLFLEDSTPRVDKLCEAIRSADPAAARREAHSLKGAAGSVGAKSLWNLCSGLEHEVGAADWTRASSDAQELRYCLDELRQHFSRAEAA